MRRDATWGLTCAGVHAVVATFLVFLKTHFGWGAGLGPLPAFVLRIVDFPLYLFGATFARIIDPVIQYANETLGLRPLTAIFVSESAVVSVLGGVYYFLIGFLAANVYSRRHQTTRRPGRGGRG